MCFCVKKLNSEQQKRPRIASPATHLCGLIYPLIKHRFIFLMYLIWFELFLAILHDELTTKKAANCGP